MSELEMMDFETRFEQRLQRYAAVTVRPVDAAAVVRDVAIKHPRRTGFAARVQDLFRVPRTAFGPVTLLILVGLLLAVLLAVVVGGNLLRKTSAPPGRNGIIGYSIQDIDQRPYNHVHLVNPDGTGDHEIAQGTFPQFTADGNHIVYFTGFGRGEPMSIVFADPDGSAPITVSDYQQLGYAVSPDGTKLLMRRLTEEDGTVPRDQWLVDIGTGESRILVPQPEAEGSPNWFNFVWSPDGKKIAYAVMQDVINGDNQGSYRTAIDIVDVETGDISRLTSRPGTDGVALGWSPDGRSIVYLGIPDGGPLPSLVAGTGPQVAFNPPQDVFVIRADGTGETNLTNTPGHEDRAMWSPDGRSILYSPFRDTDPISRIAIQEVDDALKPVGDIRLGPHAEEFVWSPDATKILFSTNAETTPSGSETQTWDANLEVVDADFAEDPILLVHSDHTVGSLTWQWLKP